MVSVRPSELMSSIGWSDKILPVCHLCSYEVILPPGFAQTLKRGLFCKIVCEISSPATHFILTYQNLYWKRIKILRIQEPKIPTSVHSRSDEIHSHRQASLHQFMQMKRPKIYINLSIHFTVNKFVCISKMTQKRIVVVGVQKWINYKKIDKAIE